MVWKNRSLYFLALASVWGCFALCGPFPAPLRAQTALESHTQKSQEGAQSPARGGSSTSGVYAPRLDANKRPITAGGTVATGPVLFEDIAAKAGLSNGPGGWTHRMGAADKRYILDTIGSGVALIDFDNDGWLDIYLVNGATDASLAAKEPAPHAALFHNNHDGTFTDVAAKAGVANDRWGFGAAVGDYDNDGWPDLYVTNFGKNRLYHNNHDGTFTDVAEKAGVTLGNWSTGATWGDYDGDGKLDLFVPGYVHYDLKNQPDPESVNASFCQFRGVKVECGPRGLPGEPDHLFRNNGDGTFTDVSVKAGVNDKAGYYGLASLFIDVNNDGHPDLLVADDSTPNYLYLNKGDGTFEDASYASGYALNKDGRETASMGIAFGDYANNGRIDIFNTTFSDDYKPLYRNDGDANFTDVSYESQIAELTIPFLGWGAAFFDYDNDGWKDLFFVNGHVYKQADTSNWGTTWAERPLLFHNAQGKRLDPVAAVVGTALAEPMSSRGMAFGDLFNNGHMGAVINNLDAHPALLKNVATADGAAANHWIAFKLVGGPKSPRDAIGAAVYLSANGMRQRGDVVSGGSYASSSDMRPHFGLGQAKAIERVEVHWPSGLVETFVPGENRLEVDTIHTLTEGTGVKVNGVPAPAAVAQSGAR